MKQLKEFLMLVSAFIAAKLLIVGVVFKPTTKFSRRVLCFCVRNIKKNHEKVKTTADSTVKKTKKTKTKCTNNHRQNMNINKVSTLLFKSLC